MEQVKFMQKILKQYADENGEIIRGTTDTSPLEQWLIMQLYKLYNDSTNTNKLSSFIIEPIPMKAGDTSVLINGKPLHIDFRIISEANYQVLKKNYEKESTC